MYAARSRKKRIRWTRRRWWVTLSRIGLLVVLLIGGLYVTLPWWVPTKLLRNWMVRDLARTMGVRVTIADLSLSWSNGIEIRGLRISSPPEFNYTPMVEIDKIRSDLSPIDLIFRNRLSWTEMEQVRLFVRTDRDGNVNLAPLRELFDYPESRRVSVHHADISLLFHGQPDELKLDVRNLQYRAGRLQRLGRVTMSAVLKGEDSQTPISLDLGAGADEKPAAHARFTFANLDLGQLSLPQLLDLPLQTLNGRCSGSLDLQLNRQGITDRCSLDLGILQLDVRPKQGPHLPVIDKAHLRVDAGYDMINRQIELHSASILLPGITLSASGRFFPELRQAPWEAIRELNIDGKIAPGQLARLLLERPILPGGFDVEGPIAVNMNLRSEGTSINLVTRVECTDTEIRRNGATLKPFGRKLQLTFGGSLEKRTWDLSIRSPDDGANRLMLGENFLEFEGTIRDVRNLRRHFGDPKHPLSLQRVLDHLKYVDCNGKWKVAELDSLRDALGSREAMLSEVSLQGEMTGGWGVTPEKGDRVHTKGEIHVPSDTHLEIAGKFVKPSGKEVHLRWGAIVRPARGSLREIKAELSIGAGAVRLDLPEVLLTGDPGGGIGVDLRGGFEVERIEQLIESLPQVRTSWVNVRGAAHGTYRGAFDPTLRELNVDMDLTRLNVVGGNWFTKPSDREAKVRVGVFREGIGRNGGTLTVEGLWSSPRPKSDVSFTAVFPNGLSKAPVDGARVEITADIKDTSHLPRFSPMLAALIGKGTLNGGMFVKVLGDLNGERLKLDLSCNADDLEYRSAGHPERTKTFQTPLKMRLTGQLAPFVGGKSTLDIKTAAIRFGKSEIELSGNVKIDKTLLVTPPIGRIPFLGGFRLVLDARCELDNAMLGFFPELVEPIHRYRLGGALSVRTELLADPKTLSMNARIDAKELSAGPFVLKPAEMTGSAGFKGIRLTKPSGLPTVITLEAASPTDLSQVRINNFRARIGDMELLVDARIGVKSQRFALPLRAKSVRSHLALTISHLGSLHQVLPDLKDYDLSGSAMLETEYDSAADAPVRYAELYCNQLRGKLHGKDLLVDGRLRVREVNLDRRVQTHGSARIKPIIGALTIDELEFRIGENHGWVFADLAELPRRPTGTVRLLGGFLDAKDLETWAKNFQRPEESPTQPVKTTTERAREIIDLVQPYVLNGDVAVRVSIDHLRTFDPVVEQYYDVRFLELNADVRQGLTKIAYAGGLNGGSLDAEHLVDFNVPDPVVVSSSTMMDVLALGNIRPQLKQYFPGNTVSGEFTRIEKVSNDLLDLLANAIDPGHALRPQGTAKTIANGGVVEGRAAPKFVTVIFPGLNLTKYRYKRMTGFAEFLEDGSAENDMIFTGPVYDMYITGTTNVDNVGKYTIGLILLNTPQSPEWNHAWRLGRIPILKVKARIEGGKMHDEEVSYPWPNDALGRFFVLNNPIYRIWVNTGKK